MSVPEIEQRIVYLQYKQDQLVGTDYINCSLMIRQLSISQESSPLLLELYKRKKDYNNRLLQYQEEIKFLKKILNRKK